MARDKYYDRPEWSQSEMKTILDADINVAVAKKRGMMRQPQSPFIDLGQLVHFLVLGGADNFAVSEFDDFRTKAAREWRDAMIAEGKYIVTKSQFDVAKIIVDERIEKHPHTAKYLAGDGIRHEVEMYAKANGVSLRGKADAVKVSDGAMIITDLKTTGKFDQFFKEAVWRHYDLQAAVYTLIGAASQKVSPAFVNYYFCVAETVEPYRVGFFHCSPEFMESGENKLNKCLDQIKAFGDAEPNFLIDEIKDLGDLSI